MKSRAQLRHGAGFGLLAALALLSSCSPGSRAAGAQPVTPESAPAPEAPPDAMAAPPAGDDSELAALLHDLRVQEQRVDRELARKAQLAVARAEEAETAAEPEAAPSRAPKTRVPAASKKKKEEASAGSAPPAAPRDDADRESNSDWIGSPCDTACRALASMERSADRICALAGEGDARCESARAMVKASRERVQTSGCWCRSFGPR